jgi:mRNA interferase MazF
VWLSLSAGGGHEQSGRRPALVISPKIYNRKVGLAILCPITTKVKGYPFEVVLREGSDVVGAVLCDQIKSLDWRARRAKLAGKASRDVLAEATAKMLTLVDP